MHLEEELGWFEKREPTLSRSGKKKRNPTFSGSSPDEYGELMAIYLSIYLSIYLQV